MSEDHSTLSDYCSTIAHNAKQASAALQLCSTDLRNHWLDQSALAIRENVAAILAANALDIAAAPSFELSEAQVDRLSLDDERVESIATALEAIALLPDPVGETISSSVRPNGLEVTKVRVPLGVVFFIYESRPNVTADAAAICLKSGNAVILRGGKEAA